MRAPESDDDGSVRAITLFDCGVHGIFAWFGVLKPEAGDVTAHDVVPSHYRQRETMGFMLWSDMHDFFAGSGYELLAMKLAWQSKRNDRPIEA
ncbi:hypothetical protein ACQQ2N_17320 [Dokdonella sp. MW10]|uniref:hypothetical protein n=1 Tax=Dokdonella sp. MW10 TaxID=2992926 RepID=UPI003F808CD7